MQNYDFSTINPTDFEKLVCDLLNKKIYEPINQIGFYSFKEGKDRGIDLIHTSRNYDFEIVVQVKHFIKSSYSALKSTLINSEQAKVSKLKPRRYIFVTSLALSYDNKKEIEAIFTPYIKSIDDIFGQDDLNDILRLSSDIEEKHFKLWFSSTVALKRIMSYKYKGRSTEFQDNVLKRKLRLFVNTKELVKAEEVLKKNKFLIITGEPGVGKTTLSDILIYKHLSREFELTVIDDDIREIEESIRDDDSKQIFYFDDFLGSTQAEIQRSRTAETVLLKLISRIENAENKYLILNTRKFIITTMIEQSERFRNFKPLRGESKIELSAYSYGAKRRMLDNHIFESDLSNDLKSVVNENAFLICNHKNFSPRHLEFFTLQLHVGQFSVEELKKYITDNLNDPKDIWGHAYQEQITLYDRLLLNTLYSLGGATNYQRLYKAFYKRLDYEVKTNNFIKPLDAFDVCLKNLNGGFIDIDPSQTGNRITFINPSLEDYLFNKIGGNFIEIERILFSAITIEQWYQFFKPFQPSSKGISMSLIEYLKNNYSQLIGDTDSDYDLYLIVIFIAFFSASERKLSLELMTQIYYWDIILDYKLTYYHRKFLDLVKSDLQFNSMLGEMSCKFFLNTLWSVTNIYDIEPVHCLMKHYGFEFIPFILKVGKNSDKYESIRDVQMNFKQLLQNEVDAQCIYLMDNSEIDAHLDIIDDIRNISDLIENYYYPKLKIKYGVLLTYDWNAIAQQNYLDDKVVGIKLTPEEYEIYEEVYNYSEYDEDYDFEKESKQQNYPQTLRYYNIDSKNLPIISDKDNDDLPF